MCIVRVTKDEFETEDGSVYPIVPPLEEEISLEEFQEHYDYASAVVRGRKKAGGDASNHPGLGSGGEDKDR